MTKPRKSIAICSRAAGSPPLSGVTTRMPTSVGSTPPNSRATHKRSAARRVDMRQTRTIPHNPPQNADDSTCGTPNGSVGFIE